MRAQFLITLILLACCALFASLGYWQTTRADGKRLIEEQLVASYASAPSELRAEAAAFSRIRARGQFNPQFQFLIENRVRNGQPGYEVIQAFDTADGLRLLVDRGWTGTNAWRARGKVAPAPSEDVEVIGLLLPDFGAGVTFENSSTENPVKSWPAHLQTLDLETMTRMAEANIPHMLKLRNGEPGALGAQAFELPMSSERHTAYAVQWFGLALTAIIIWILLARRQFARRRTSND